MALAGTHPAPFSPVASMSLGLSCLLDSGLEPLIDLSALKVVERWESDNTGDAVSQPQPNVPDPSFPIPDPTPDFSTALVTASNQRQWSMSQAHSGGDVLFESPEVSPLCFWLYITY